MNANQVGPLLGQGHGNSHRARGPFFDNSSQQLREKSLPRMADKYRPAGPLQTTDRGEQGEVVSGSLPEPNTWIENNPVKWKAD